MKPANSIVITNYHCLQIDLKKAKIMLALPLHAKVTIFTGVMNAPSLLERKYNIEISVARTQWQAHGHIS